MSNERVEVVFGANITDLTTKVRQAAVATKESVEQMNASMQSLKNYFSGIGEALAAFTAVQMFKHLIDDVAELGGHLDLLSQKTGVAVEDLSRLRYAADLSHIGADTLDMGLKKLARGMQDAARDGTTPAAEAFKALGISVTDAQGVMRPMNDVLLDVAAKFATYEDGAAKSALAMNLFGKSGTDMVPLLNQGKAGIQELGQESDRLGATMTAFQAETAHEYESSMKRMDAGARGLKQTMAVALMPVLGSLADAFTHNGEAGDLLTGTLEVVAGALRFIGTVAVVLKGIVQETFETVRILFEGVATVIAGVGAAIQALFQRDWAGAVRIGKATFSELGDNVAASNKRMKASADETVLSLQRLYGFKNETDSDAGKSTQTKKAPGLPDKGKDKEKSTQLADAEADWQATRDGTTATADALLVIERDFWAKKLGQIRQGETDTESATKAMNGKRLAAALKLQQDETKAALIRIQIKRDADLEALDAEKVSVEESRSLHTISASEAEARLIALNARVLAIKQQALADEAKLVKDDVVKQADYDRQIETGKRASAAAVLKINKDTTLQLAQDYEKTFSHITDVIRKSFDGVIMGTQTLRDAMRNLNRNMVLDFAASKLEELKVHLAAEKAKEGVSWGSAITRVAADTWASLKSVAASAWSALVQIGHYAAVAAAASWAAIAGIPYVGPFLAPIAAGVALVGVLALGSRVASAAGGYDIPAGINPMTQLHASEMVLPAELANKVRGMAQGGEGGGGGDTYHFNFIDAAGVRVFADTHRDELASAVKKSVKYRNG